MTLVHTLSSKESVLPYVSAASLRTGYGCSAENFTDSQGIADTNSRKMANGMIS